MISLREVSIPAERAEIFVTMGIENGSMVEPRYYEITSPRYFITLEPRPRYCDRGEWIAKISSRPGEEMLDQHEGWPRYYFDKQRALDEIGDWLVKRGEA